MSFFSVFRNMTGVAGGVTVYVITKAAAILANRHIRRQRLSPEVKEIMKPLFPELNIDRVSIKEGSTIPPNWFRKIKKYTAITFGYTIYFTGTGIQTTNTNLNILIHELVHTDQVRSRGNCEGRFAADYGKGFLAAGNYRDNPLEKEAFDFESSNRLPIA
jgi:hypothetical protein